MEDLMEILLGAVLGAMVMYWLFSLFRRKRSREITEHQSTVLLEKIKSVCKLISVEGDFAEIYKFENTRDWFMGLVSEKKKALIVINARAQIGYDLRKVILQADVDKKRIILKGFPEPEILTIEPDLEFYDIQNGLFNTFRPKDLTNLNKEAKQFIRDKIPESVLMESARKEAIEVVMLIEKIVETIGWKLDYSAIKLPETKKPLIEL